MYTIPCPRCLGKKQFNHYSNIKNGVCFECNGSGEKKVDSKTYHEYQESVQRVIESNRKGEAKQALENSIIDSAYPIKNSVDMAKRLQHSKDEEDIFVYNRTKAQIVAWMNKYNAYKYDYKTTIARAEEVMSYIMWCKDE